MEPFPKQTLAKKPRGVFYRISVTRFTPEGARSRSVTLRPMTPQEAAETPDVVLARLIAKLEDACE